MVNVGHPSTGCHLCRKRRVKCDEHRPGCRNCARIKRACPGYRDSTWVYVVDSVDGHSSPSESSPPGTQDKTRPLSQADHSTLAYTAGYEVLPVVSSIDDPSASNKENEQGQTYAGQQHHNWFAICSQPQQEFTEQAIVWCRHTYYRDTIRLYRNNDYEFVDYYLQRTSTSSPIQSAFKALSIADLANRCPTSGLYQSVYSQYVDAVRRVNEALNDTDQCLTDETLVAIWLLMLRDSTIDVAGSEKYLPSSPSSAATRRLAHVDGTLMLLKLRGERQFSTSMGQHLFRILLSGMHWKPLLESEEPPQILLDLERLLPQATPNWEDIHRATSSSLRNFYHGVTKLRCRMKNFRSRPHVDVVTKCSLVSSYLKAAYRLQHSMQDWCTPTAWLPILITQSVKCQSRLDQAYLLNYYTGWDGFFHWNRYWAAQAFLHSALIQALELVPSDIDLGHGKNVAELIHENILAFTSCITQYIGHFGWAYGDIDNQGLLREMPTPATNPSPYAPTRGIYIAASLQIFAPGRYIVALEHLRPEQRRLLAMALERGRTEFRLR